METIAATRKEVVPPNRDAMAGVNEAVTALPICPPMFMKGEERLD
ncbi:MAG: hypothetical protein WB795_18615 [Candidatus Acidiferrales bacterium]